MSINFSLSKFPARTMNLYFRESLIETKYYNSKYYGNLLTYYSICNQMMTSETENNFPRAVSKFNTELW